MCYSNANSSQQSFDNFSWPPLLVIYIPIPKHELVAIWAKQKELVRDIPAHLGLAEDERVEDAGLDHEDEPLPPTRSKKKTRERLAA